jgi:hypothetical protein
MSLFKGSEGLPELSLVQTARPQARVILSSPTGAPIFGIIDFRSITLTDTQVEVVMHGLDVSLPHVGHPYHSKP